MKTILGRMKKTLRMSQIYSQITSSKKAYDCWISCNVCVHACFFVALNNQLICFALYSMVLLIFSTTSIFAHVWDIGCRLYPPDNSCFISAVSCIVLSKSCDPLGQVLAAQGPAHSFWRWPELLLSASVVLALFWVSRHSVLVLLCVECSKLILLEQDCLEGGAM